jgi:hypothetical protein
MTQIIDTSLQGVLAYYEAMVNFLRHRKILQTQANVHQEDLSAVLPGSSLEASANALGVSIFTILAASRDPVIWELIGGGFGNRVPANLTAAGKAELRKNLNAINSGLIERAKTGDVNAALASVGISWQLAGLAE